MENALLTKINSMESKLLCDICGEKGDRIEIEGRYGVLCPSPKCYKQAEGKVATRKQKDQEEYIKAVFIGVCPEGWCEGEGRL